MLLSMVCMHRWWQSRALDLQPSFSSQPSPMSKQHILPGPNCLFSFFPAAVCKLRSPDGRESSVFLQQLSRSLFGRNLLGIAMSISILCICGVKQCIRCWWRSPFSLQLGVIRVIRVMSHPTIGSADRSAMTLMGSMQSPQRWDSVGMSQEPTGTQILH